MTGIGLIQNLVVDGNLGNDGISIDNSCIPNHGGKGIGFNKSAEKLGRGFNMYLMWAFSIHQTSKRMSQH